MLTLVFCRQTQRFCLPPRRTQLVCIILCQPTVLLILELHSFLDSEQRIIASKVIKRFILHAKKTAFVIEHDFIMATYLADRVIVFEGQPARSATATPYVFRYSAMEILPEGKL